MVEPRAPLAHRAADLSRIDAVEVPFLTQIDVRCDADHAQRLGFPSTPNAVTTVEAHAVLWLAPDEWLVVSTDTVAEIERWLTSALADSHHAIVDVSANRALIELRGAARWELLASGCSLDLEPEGGWAPEVCAQTLFARAQVLLQELPNATRLFVRPSFGDYVVDRLLAASRWAP